MCKNSSGRHWMQATFVLPKGSRGRRLKYINAVRYIILACERKLNFAVDSSTLRLPWLHIRVRLVQNKRGAWQPWHRASILWYCAKFTLGKGCRLRGGWPLSLRLGVDVPIEYFLLSSPAPRRREYQSYESFVSGPSPCSQSRTKLENHSGR